LIFKNSGTGNIMPLPANMPRFSVWRSIGAMLLEIGGLLALNSFVTKRRDSLFAIRNRNKRIIVLERTAVDHRRSLLLVEVDGQRIVLGLGPDRMDTVAVLAGKAPEGAIVNENNTGKADYSFTDSLKSLMGKENR
jgi:flagellar biogenesis protein FliO